MVPSWFVPFVGIIVADVVFPGGELRPFAEALLGFGMTAYAILLPMMMYRLIFSPDINDNVKPTIAIMAAPASLALTGYLAISQHPSPIIISLLAGIAVLMTLFIYLSFFKLLRLPFSAGFAAYTFPLVISATALYKVAIWMGQEHFDVHYVHQVRELATFELIIATVVVAYVAIRYLIHFKPISVLMNRN